jgi:hypothetical protein
MTECILCNAALEATDRRLEYPCGCHAVHSTCGIRRLQADYNTYNDHAFACQTCQRILITGELPQVEEDPMVPVRSPAFQSEFKQLKKKRAQSNQANKAFQRQVHQTYLQFLEEMRPNLESIQVRKEMLIRTLKASEEYLEARRKITGLTRLENLFRTRYNLGWGELDEYRFVVGRRQLRMRTPLRFLHNRFRLRL